jgi:excisionase family DNA binding protein
MPEPIANSQHGREFLSPQELATRTGLSVETVRRRVRDGSLPSIQPGGPGKRILISIAAFMTTLRMPETAGDEGCDLTVGQKAAAAPKGRGRLPGPEPSWRRAGTRPSTGEHIAKAAKT